MWTNCQALILTSEMSVYRQSGKLGLVIWTKCHCFEIFFLMCFLWDDKSQACAGDNNTKCLTAFLTIVWLSVCLIIVSITHTGKLLSKKAQRWLSECVHLRSSCRPILWALVTAVTGGSVTHLCCVKGLVNLRFLGPRGDVILLSNQTGKQSRKCCWRISERW